jgi:hypothetical protein
VQLNRELFLRAIIIWASLSRPIPIPTPLHRGRHDLPHRAGLFRPFSLFGSSASAENRGLGQRHAACTQYLLRALSLGPSLCSCHSSQLFDALRVARARRPYGTSDMLVPYSMWCIGLDLDLIPIGSSVHSHATASRLDPDAAQVQVSLYMSGLVVCYCVVLVTAASWEHTMSIVRLCLGKEREKTLVFYTTKLKAVTIRLSALMHLYIHPLYVLVSKILFSILNSSAHIHPLYHPLSTVGPTYHFI